MANNMKPHSDDHHPADDSDTNDLQWISQRLLLTVKKDGDTSQLRKLLEECPYNELLKQLQEEDGSKLVFWINVYNSYYQILRKDLGLTSKEIYGSRSIVLAGKKWSLDDIEHSVLRSCTYKYGYGYIPNLLVPCYVRKVAMSNVDWRVHFALNCGAQSCPRIAYYSSEQLDEQLKRATYSFLHQETEVMEDEIHISKLFYWFSRDFGGTKGIKQILKDTLNIADVDNKKLVYTEYSWEEKLENYAF